MLNADEFVKDLENGAFSADEGVVGLTREPCVRIWFHRFCTLEEYLAPSFVPHICANFLSVLGRRARKLALAGVQKRATLTRGVEYRAL